MLIIILEMASFFRKSQARSGQASSKVKNYGDTGTPVYKCDDETKQIQLWKSVL